MKEKEHSEAAAILEAITKDWALFDIDPDIDFLIFVNENRDELDFYPKKSFVQMMEQSDLIENLDKDGASVREPYTYYKGDRLVWQEITEAGTIMFQYRVTPKGRLFLRDAPKLIGKPLPPLRVATSPIEIPSKQLKVVTYDRQAIKKLVDAFIQKARSQIDALFMSSINVDSSVSSSGYLVCGPTLWRKLESQAWLNGLRPTSMLVEHTSSLTGGKEKNSTKLLEDQPLSTSDEVRLFWRTLRETFKLEGLPLIRRAEAAEASAYLHQEQIRDDDFPAPDLSSLQIMFIVEANKSKFVVLVESKSATDMKHFGPQITWIELMQSTDRQE